MKILLGHVGGHLKPFVLCLSKDRLCVFGGGKTRNCQVYVLPMGVSSTLDTNGEVLSSLPDRRPNGGGVKRTPSPFVSSVDETPIRLDDRLKPTPR